MILPMMNVRQATRYWHGTPHAMVRASVAAFVVPLAGLGCVASAPVAREVPEAVSARSPLPEQTTPAEVSAPIAPTAVPTPRPALVIDISDEENEQLRRDAAERERRYQEQEIRDFGRILTDGERREVRQYGRVLGEEERVEFARIAAERESQREANEIRRRELRLEEERLKRQAELEAERLAIERERIEAWRPYWPHEPWVTYPQRLVPRPTPITLE